MNSAVYNWQLAEIGGYNQKTSPVTHILYFGTVISKFVYFFGKVFFNLSAGSKATLNFRKIRC